MPLCQTHFDRSQINFTVMEMRENGRTPTKFAEKRRGGLRPYPWQTLVWVVGHGRLTTNKLSD